MRTNHAGVTETAHLKTDLAKYSESHVAVFGERKEFCDKCDLRLSYCECKKEESEEDV